MTEHRQLNLAGVVLAGGRSRRMGQDKASMEWEGRPLLTVVTDVLAQRCSPVLVAASNTSQAYAELRDVEDVDWITSEPIGSGPLGGLVAALEAAEAADSPAAFVCATDMPMIAPELIDELLHGLTTSADAVVVHDGGRDHPMAAIYRTRVVPVLVDLLDSGEQRMVAALDAIQTHRVGVSDPAWLTNVDSPEDLHRLRA
ncbi:molybdenum cofactor guanylyltransferase [Gordonia hirsuta]|nr:molybdenum cofactor guanylyltransferase [Gordonia hirsuta]